MNQVTEASYPVAFRADDAATLGQHIKQHNSVVIIGMKRVGISNFLRFFLYHPQIDAEYIKNGQKPLFIPVDLNDLVEREIFPFWVLLLKRLIDTIENTPISEADKKKAHKLFTESIQLKDLFFTLDCVQKVIKIIIASGYYPTIFLIRFDRLKDVITSEFFHNLQGLKDAAKQKLSFVFTSYRPLYQVSPAVFTKTALSLFSHDMYLKPAGEKDMQTIGTSFITRYQLDLPAPTFKTLIALAGGHVHYLQLMLLKFQDSQTKNTPGRDLLKLMSADEEMVLQSEELFASLTRTEQEILLKVHRHEVISPDQIKQEAYVWETGMIAQSSAQRLFSPIFTQYLSSIKKNQPVETDFTKKEHVLFSYLKSHDEVLCEREDIVEAVWPEQTETGVSDWAVDRLVARVRAKLKEQKSPYEIVTVITRGYKLVKKVA